MALTERTVIDKYEIAGEFNHIQCRHATVIERDGVEISRSFHRDVIAPGDDVTGEPQEVQALVALMHTPAVITAYEAHVVASQEV
tara:strand:- start:530 stop:784 length:255 start_codon:yes stop_codon:yes gene_type:complete